MQQRRCNDEQHIGPRYLPVSEFHKMGFKNGRQRYNTRCKDCVNRISREKYAEGKRANRWPPEKKRAYSRARSRALTKLAKLVPELYGNVLEEELAKETDYNFSDRGQWQRKLY